MFFFKIVLAFIQIFESACKFLQNACHDFDRAWIESINWFGLPWWLSGKESACSAGDAGDMGSIPGLGRYPGGGNGNHSSILAWKIPWTETGRLQSIWSERVRHDWSDWACTHAILSYPVWMWKGPTCSMPSINTCWV